MPAGFALTCTGVAPWNLENALEKLSGVSDRKSVV